MVIYKRLDEHLITPVNSLNVCLLLSREPILFPVYGLLDLERDILPHTLQIAFSLSQFLILVPDRQLLFTDHVLLILHRDLMVQGLPLKFELELQDLVFLPCHGLFALAELSEQLVVVLFLRLIVH